MDQSISTTDGDNTILRTSEAVQASVQVIPGSIRNIQWIPSRGSVLPGAALSPHPLPGVMHLLAQIPTASSDIPVNRTLPPLWPALATSMQVRDDLLITGQASGAGKGTPNSGAEKRVGEGSGTHQREKVRKGTFQKFDYTIKEWADNRKKQEAEFKQYFAAKGVHEPLPWNRETMNDTGNKLKALYMDLTRKAYEGVVELVRGDVSQGLFGITRIKILDRKTFDAGQFPTLTASGIFDEPKYKDLKYKVMFKLWKTAGFAEMTQHGSAYLELKFKNELKQQVKDQVAETRRRQKERSNTVQADV